MRVLMTGQIGLDKRSYLESAKRFTRENGQTLEVFNVGDMMYAETPDVRQGRILDLPHSRLHAIRRSVFKDIIHQFAGKKNAIINTHATFRWRHGLFRAFDFDQMQELNPDLLICLIDTVNSIYHRLTAKHTLDVTLKDIMMWREEEILATELLALALGRHEHYYILARGKSEPSLRLLDQLVCQPELPKIYLSFPMSHVVGMPDVLAEIDEFRETMAQRYVVFDPAALDDRLLLDRAIEVVREGGGFVTSTIHLDDGSTTECTNSVKQILEIAGDIDGQIYMRDFQFIDQSDMIISLVPELPSGLPALSSGVERELHHAFEHGKEVYVIWHPSRPPSPFITETATQVVKTTQEVMEILDGRSSKVAS